MDLNLGNERLAVGCMNGSIFVMSKDVSEEGEKEWKLQQLCKVRLYNHVCSVRNEPFGIV